MLLALLVLSIFHTNDFSIIVQRHRQNLAAPADNFTIARQQQKSGSFR